MDYQVGILTASASENRGLWNQNSLLSNRVVNRTLTAGHLFGHGELMVMHGAFEKKNDQNVGVGSGFNEPAQPAAVLAT